MKQTSINNKKYDIALEKKCKKKKYKETKNSQPINLSSLH